MCRQGTGINAKNRAGHQFLPVPHHSQVCTQGTGIIKETRVGTSSSQSGLSSKFYNLRKMLLFSSWTLFKAKFSFRKRKIRWIIDNLYIQVPAITCDWVFGIPWTTSEARINAHIIVKFFLNAVRKGPSKKISEVVRTYIWDNYYFKALFLRSTSSSGGPEDDASIARIHLRNSQVLPEIKGKFRNTVVILVCTYNQCVADPEPNPDTRSSKIFGRNRIRNRTKHCGVQIRNNLK